MVWPPYPAAVRLCGVAADHWDTLCAQYYQINLLRIPTHRFLGHVYAYAIERVEHGKMEEWIAELNELLPWQDGESEAAVQAESDSFYAAMMAQGGG